MSEGGDDVQESGPIAAVEAWRARGAARSHAVAFRIVEALARRAAAQQGEARRLMLQRVDQLIAGHADAGGAATPAADPRDGSAAGEASARREVLAGLSALVDRLGRTSTQPAAQRPIDTPKAGTPSPRSPQPPAPSNAVTAFKGTWSRLRADQRLRQAVSQVPAMAGPLNSSHVVNRTLQTMRDLSPEYLEAFMAHVDTLLWIERASGGGEFTRPLSRGKR